MRWCFFIHACTHATPLGTHSLTHSLAHSLTLSRLSHLKTAARQAPAAKAAGGGACSGATAVAVHDFPAVRRVRRRGVRGIVQRGVVRRHVIGSVVQRRLLFLLLRRRRVVVDYGRGDGHGSSEQRRGRGRTALRILRRRRNAPVRKGERSSIFIFRILFVLAPLNRSAYSFTRPSNAHMTWHLSSLGTPVSFATRAARHQRRTPRRCGGGRRRGECSRNAKPPPRG